MARGSGRSSAGSSPAATRPRMFWASRPCLVGGNLAVSRDHAPLVGGLSAAVAGVVVDDEGSRAYGIDTDTEAGELVVPRDPRLSGRFEGVNRLLRFVVVFDGTLLQDSNPRCRCCEYRCPSRLGGRSVAHKRGRLIREPPS